MLQLNFTFNIASSVSINIWSLSGVHVSLIVENRRSNSADEPGMHIAYRTSREIWLHADRSHQVQNDPWRTSTKVWWHDQTRELLRMRPLLQIRVANTLYDKLIENLQKKQQVSVGMQNDGTMKKLDGLWIMGFKMTKIVCRSLWTKS